MNPSDKAEKVSVWPEMVLRETIAALIAMLILLLAAIYFEAPLEELANPSYSMNPSKAPWYFLGLQELLVYFPPWIAGVLIPLTVIAALMLIPYLDICKKTTAGIFCRYARGINIAFSCGMFLWLFLTMIGMFFRGPNWTLQWPDGTPLGGQNPVVPHNWLPPMIAILYLLGLLRPGKKKIVQEINDATLYRYTMYHLLTLGLAIIFLEILFYALISQVS